MARSFSEQHKIDFFNHLGYVNMAIRAQVPILPIVGCGGEAVFVINSGKNCGMDGDEKVRSATYLAALLVISFWVSFGTFTAF